MHGEGGLVAGSKQSQGRRKGAANVCVWGISHVKVHNDSFLDLDIAPKSAAAEARPTLLRYII